ncbi:hypothetical protein HK096_000271, partial [Nowakowskiella sp. JEL0078]
MLGLTAPQVSIPLRLIAVRISDDEEVLWSSPSPLSREMGDLLFLVNPVLATKNQQLVDAFSLMPKFSKEEVVIEVNREACESVPGYSALVKRSRTVCVSALDLDGNK